MNSEINISIQELVAILGLVATVSGIFGTILWNMWTKMSSNAEEIKEGQRQQTKELADFKVEVATKYVSTSQLNDLEQKIILGEDRMLAAITTLSNRVDRLLDTIKRDN